MFGSREQLLARVVGEVYTAGAGVHVTQTSCKLFEAKTNGDGSEAPGLAQRIKDKRCTAADVSA